MDQQALLDEITVDRPQPLYRNPTEIDPRARGHRVSDVKAVGSRILDHRWGWYLGKGIAVGAQRIEQARLCRQHILARAGAPGAKPSCARTLAGTTP